MGFISKRGKAGLARRCAPLWSRLTLAATLILGGFGSAHAGLIFNLEDQTNGGGFFATVELNDKAANTVSIKVNIAEPVNDGISSGDILTIFFDVDPVSLLDGLSATNGQVLFGTGKAPGGTTGTFTPILTYDLSTLSSNQNLNSNQIALTFDLAVELGDNGGKDGFFQTLTFDLVADSSNTGFEAAIFDGQNIGLRVQSIAGVTDYTADSSKLTGTSTNVVPVPGTLALLGAGLVGFSIVRRRPTSSAAS